MERAGLHDNTPGILQWRCGRVDMKMKPGAREFAKAKDRRRGLVAIIIENC